MTSFMLSSKVTLGVQFSSFLALVMSNQILVTSPCQETPVVVTTVLFCRLRIVRIKLAKLKYRCGFAKAQVVDFTLNKIFRANSN